MSNHNSSSILGRDECRHQSFMPRLYEAELQVLSLRYDVAAQHAGTYSATAALCKFYAMVIHFVIFHSPPMEGCPSGVVLFPSYGGVPVRGCFIPLLWRGARPGLFYSPPMEGCPSGRGGSLKVPELPPYYSTHPQRQYESRLGPRISKNHLFVYRILLCHRVTNHQSQ